MDDAVGNDMLPTRAPTALSDAPLAETDASQLQARCIAAAMSSHQDDDCAACKVIKSVARLASPIKKTELFSRPSRREHRSRGPANIISALEDLAMSDWLSGSLAGHEHDHQEGFLVADSLNGGQALERQEDFHSHADHIATC